MLRKTLTILSLLGLLLSVGLWGVSYWNVGYYSQQPVFLVALYSGVLELYDVEKARNSGVVQPKRKPGLTILGFADFRTYVIPYIRITNRVTHIALPLWIPVLSFGILPSLVIAAYRRRRKRKKLGLCLKCGYDLRASKERCPECGTPRGKP